jgi:hypothetical protein
VAERWALLATIAIWWGSSLPVYMYFNPSWSHAHSAFTVALFFWYWLRTRESRSVSEWFWLGLIAGLALNVYYPNAVVLLLLVPEAAASYRAASEKAGNAPGFARLLQSHLLFCAVVLVVLLPTFLTKYAIYGGVFETGYIPIRQWSWSSPWFLALLFSANHGLFSWTPILIFAVAGIFFLVRREPRVGSYVLSVLLGFYYFMAAYPDWPGISSYGNRFFVSLTVFFVLGLASFLERLASLFRGRRAALASLTAGVCLFIVWNLGLIFQWGAHLIPARGPVSWHQVAYNQVEVVPRQALSQLDLYLFRRKKLLHQIEQRDLEELRRPSQ